MPYDAMDDTSEAPLLAEDATSIAVVGSDDTWRDQLQAALDLQGFRIKKFASLDDLWQVVFCGESFAALIQRTMVTINWHASPAPSFRTGDMLLMLHASHFRALAINDGNFDSAAFDIASSTASAQELKWRLKMLLRNAREKESGLTQELVFGDYSFDLRVRLARMKGAPVSLTSAEFDIAVLLFRSRNSVVSTQQFSLLLDRDFSPGSRVLAVYMTRLRTKLALRGEHGATLRAVYGRGYFVQQASN